MKTNEIKTRPMSSKPNKTRPTVSKPSIIKTEETQIETMTNKNKNTLHNFSEEKINESEEENISKSYIINKSKSTIEKLDFLDSLAKGSRKDSFINLLDEEAQRIDKINDQKQKLNKINLKETDIEGLYDWKTLFNNSRPLSHYTRINYKKPIITEEKEKDDIKSPKILVDLPDDKMIYFFGKNAFDDDFNNPKNKKNKNKNVSTFRKANTNNNFNISNTQSCNDKTQTLKSNRSNNNNTKIRASSKIKSSRTFKSGKKINNKKDNNHNYIKPISIYSKFDPEDTFYFSNTFSDYYKEDLKSFTNKMPILKAKIKTNSNKLKRIIKKQRIKSSNKEKQLYDMLIKDPLILKKQDLIISAERKNPVPLMKSIFKQENPDAVEIKENIRKYFNTMKPYGNDDGKTDYTKNDRWRLYRELVKFRKGKYFDEENKNENGYYMSKKRKLILSYYDINDPHVQIFNNLNINEQNKINYSFEYNNNINNLDNINIFDNLDNSKFEDKNISKSVENIIEEKNKDNKIINMKKEDKNENTIKKNYNIKKRPRTGFKSSRDINILKNEKIKSLIKANRPHSSNLRRNNNLTENKIFDLKDYNELYINYLPSNRFPVKTSSKVKNASYNKINEMIKKRYLKKLSDDYFITQPDNFNSNYNFDNFISTDNSEINKSIPKPKIRPKTAGGIRPNTKMNINLDNINNKNEKEQKCNYLYFNKYINTNYDLNINNNNQPKGYFAPMNCFNKLAGKYYSSSNNVHIKKRRMKRKEILDNYYGNYNREFLKNKLYL